jgi:hypothetical protein
VSTIGDAFFHHQGAACERSRRSSSPKTYMWCVGLVWLIGSAQPTILEVICTKIE